MLLSIRVQETKFAEKKILKLLVVYISLYSAYNIYLYLIHIVEMSIE